MEKPRNHEDRMALPPEDLPDPLPLLTTPSYTMSLVDCILIACLLGLLCGYAYAGYIIKVISG